MIYSDVTDEMYPFTRVLPAMRLLPLLALCFVAAPLGAQGTIARTTQLHAVPGARPVATLHEGATVRIGSARGGYTEVTVEGWVSGSFIAGRREQFPISIRLSSEDVRMRAGPNTSSSILAEMRGGMGLTEISRRSGWVRVRRTGWVPTAAVQSTVARRSPARQPSPSTKAPAAAERPAASPSPAAASDSGSTARTDAGTVLVERVPVSQLLTLGGSIALRRAPDGDAVATIEPGARLVPVARERGWVKVQIEGWVRESELLAADTSVRASLSAADLRAEPERMRGQLVRWNVQVLSFQTADPLRRGMALDEPYLLARGPGEENALLYLTIPASLIETARTVPPLTSVSIVARVRTGRSDPAGVPILELQSLARVP